MSEVAKSTQKQHMQTAGVIAVTLVILNIAFFLLSRLYYEDSMAGDLENVRRAFGTTSILIGMLTYVATLAPRLIGHGIAVVLGIISLVSAVMAYTHDLPSVMVATLLIIGGLLPLLAWRSWLHSRAAWSFLIAVLAVFGGVDFFGAPKIRSLIGISLWDAMIIPGMQVIAVIALSMLRSEYRER